MQKFGAAIRAGKRQIASPHINPAHLRILDRRSSHHGFVHDGIAEIHLAKVSTAEIKLNATLTVALKPFMVISKYFGNIL